MGFKLKSLIWVMLSFSENINESINHTHLKNRKCAIQPYKN